MLLFTLLALNSEVDHCSTYDESGSCLKCFEHYYVAENGKCSQCGDSVCLECLDTNTCLSCGMSHMLKNGQCINFDKCYNDYFPKVVPDSSGKGGVCSSCNHHENGNCTKCTELICTECQPGSFLFDDSCIDECPDNYYPDDSSCRDCYFPNCKKCLTDSKCKVCDYKFYLQDNGCVEGCDDGYYISKMLPSGECTKCPETLGSCNLCNDNTSCLECNNGQYLQNGICFATCSYENGFYPSQHPENGINGICSQCSDNIMNCELCSNEQKCDVCGNNAYLYNNTCHITCPDGTFISNSPTNSINGKCGKCFQDNCAECNADDGQCLSCMNNHYLYNGTCHFQCPYGTYQSSIPMDEKGGECSKCSDVLTESCLECSSEQQCTYCMDELFIYNGKCTSDCGDYKYHMSIGNSLYCYDCSENCYFCTNYETCITCGENYILKDDWCVELSACSDGYIMTKDPDPITFLGGECTACKALLPFCESCDKIDHCLTCFGDGYMKDEECITDCGVGFYKDEISHTCITCPIDQLGFCNQCEKVNGTIICLECQNNTLLLPDTKICRPSCTIDQFIESTPDQFGIGGKCKYCRDAMPLCTRCLNSTYCYGCDSGNFANGSYCKGCSTTLPGCLHCSTSDKCTYCDYNNHYYLNTTTYECLYCYDAMEGCNYCMNGEECEFCQQGYFKNVDKCQHCLTVSTGCLECSDKETCTVCDQENGFFLTEMNGSKVCRLCKSTLLGEYCSQCSDEDTCLRCTNNTYLQDDKCVEKCNITYYESISGKESGNECTFCKAKLNGCFSCESASKCNICDDFTYLHSDNKCYIACDDFHYDTSEPNIITGIGGECTLCDNAMSNCHKCDNSSVCLQCKNNKYLQNGECKDYCEFGYYISNKGTGSIGQECQPCPKNLGGCHQCLSSTVCTECNESTYLKIENGISKCVEKSECKSGYYISKEPNEIGIGGICPTCDSASSIIGSCNECRQEIVEVCEECKNGWKLHDTVCKQICSDGWWDEGGSVSTGGFCTRCQDNITVITENCSKCISTEACIECANSTYLKKIDNIQTCVNDCGIEYYTSVTGVNGKGGECEHFPSNLGDCQWCESSSICNICNQGSYLIDEFFCDFYCPDDYWISQNSSENSGGKCQECSDTLPNCIQCFDGNTCTKCSDRYVLHENRCHTACPVGFYPYKDSDRGRICIECPKDGSIGDCYDCSSASICRVCMNYTLLKGPKCVEQCIKDEGYIVETRPDEEGYGGVCTACYRVNDGSLGECYICDNVTHCFECQEYNYLENHVCKEKCSETHYISSKYDSYGHGATYTICPNNNIVGDCYSCVNESYCTKCENYQYLKNDKCVSECGDGYYISTHPNSITGIGGICTLCTSSPSNLGECNKCSNQDTCLECKSGEYLEENKCVSSCGTQYYISQDIDEDGIGGECTKCSLKMDQCESCLNESICTSCHNNYYLKENKCYSECRPYYYISLKPNNKIGGECSLCPFGLLNEKESNLGPCRECITYDECVLCENNEYLKDNKCYSLCGDGYYISTHPNSITGYGGECTLCTSSPSNLGECNKCSNQDTCLECKSGEYLEENKCVSSCGTQYYISQDIDEDGIGGECTKCSLKIDHCESCSNNVTCTICHNDYYLKENICVIECGEGWYHSTEPNSITGIGGICTLCTSSPSNLGECNKCSNQDTCLECKSGEYLEENKCLKKCSNNYYISQDIDENDIGGECTICLNDLMKCEQCDNSTICTLCHDNYYLREQECYFECGSHYYISQEPDGETQEGGECLHCPNSLGSCYECSTSTQCLICENFEYLKNDKCVSECGEGWYHSTEPNSITGIGGICTLCTSSPSNLGECNKCSNQDTCLECKSGEYLEENKCLKKCSNNYYISQDIDENDIGGECTKCSLKIDQCESCSNNVTCTICHNDYYLKENICVIECGEGWYHSTEPNSITGIGGICTLCTSSPSNLGECNKCSNQDTCLECKSGEYLEENKCLKKCSNNYYISQDIDENDIGGECTICLNDLMKCEQCDNSTICTLCHDNYYLREQECYFECGSHYYISQEPDGETQEGGECLHCPNSLGSCYECSTSTQCLICENFEYLKNDKCVSECGEGWYHSTEPNSITGIGGICTLCTSSPSNLGECNKCSNQDTCLECKSGEYLEENKCLKKCSNNYYISQDIDENDIGGECTKCSLKIDQCESCSNNVTCTICHNDYYLKENICVIECGEGWYHSTEPNSITGIGGICTLCTSSPSNLGECNKCSNQDTCLECKSGEYLEENKCLKKCSNNYYISQDIDENDIGGECTICLNDLMKCEQCDNSTICTLCHDNYYLREQECYFECGSHYYISQEPDGETQEGGECLHCPNSLGSCYECSTSTQCLICENFEYLKNDKCVSECGEGWYHSTEPNSITGIGGICTLCTSSPSNLGECNKCSNQDTCLECKSGEYLEENKCIKECSSGYFIKQNSSTEGFAAKCENCQNHKNLIGDCQLCSSESVCTRCQGNQFLKVDKCVVKCDDGYYDSHYHNFYGYNGLCSKCDIPLKNCSQCPNSSVCTECKEEKWLQDGSCINECQLHYYEKSFGVNGIGKECQHCSEGCHTCPGNNCTSCFDSYFLELNKETLLYECQLCNSTIPDCILCDNSDICTSCEHGKYLTSSFTCEEGCREGFYESNSSNNGVGLICLLCADSITNCYSCSSFDVCTSCGSGKWLQNNKCVDKCSSETYYHDTINGIKVCSVCKDVIFNCIECESSTKCIICDDEFVQFHGYCINECPYGYVEDIQGICIDQSNVDKHADQDESDGVLKSNILIVYKYELDDGSDEGIPLKYRGEITWVDTSYTNVTMIGRATPRSEFYLRSNSSVTNITIDSEGDIKYGGAIFGIRTTENPMYINFDQKVVPVNILSDVSESTLNINSFYDELQINGKLTLSNSIFVMHSEKELLESITIVELIIYQQSLLSSNVNKIFVDYIELKRSSISSLYSVEIQKELTIDTGSSTTFYGTSTINPTTQIILYYNASTDIRTPAIILEDGIDLPDKANKITIQKEDGNIDTETGNNPDWKIICGYNFVSCENWTQLFGVSTLPYGAAECRTLDDSQICLVAYESDANNNEQGEHGNDQTKNFPFYIIGIIAGFLVLSTTGYIIWRYIVIWKNKERSTSDSMMTDDEEQPETVFSNDNEDEDDDEFTL